MKRLALLTIAASALAACSTPKPPPAISYDREEPHPAAIEPAPIKPVEVVQIPVPLPLPGQLLPEPTPLVPDARPPVARVAAANAAAMQEPASLGYLNAVQVYPYTEGALYRLYTAPEQVSDLALQPGETLSAISAGDTVRWVIGDTTSGSGAEKRVHVLVKPFAPGLHTNLLIATDRRVYHLQLESTAKTAMAAVSWTYPQDELLKLQRRSAEAEAGAPVTADVALQDLHFRYAISGDTPPWRPLRAFDDGHKVYIAFPRRLDQGEAPPLFVVGPSGDGQLVNYRVRDAYYIVDRLFGAAELRLGADPQQVVRISRTDGPAAGTASTGDGGQP
ncbi:type IV secretion system protein VirB9 [Nitrospirillum amazonense]|uniref:Type IV secretion system protein VirB9 n=1 Tax=Nitrospirillum amazonense TaxID=28077 RepID=A0A560K2J5_9PROT|nr:P-type conjugative transfer protein TrbG [Nitrospirillum amazonense]TWB77209.1 type IV secretion system protein VirB9 [Nitrospirillum amazonense]